MPARKSLFCLRGNLRGTHPAWVVYAWNNIDHWLEKENRYVKMKMEKQSLKESSTFFFLRELKWLHVSNRTVVLQPVQIQKKKEGKRQLYLSCFHTAIIERIKNTLNGPKKCSSFSFLVCHRFRPLQLKLRHRVGHTTQEKGEATQERAVLCFKSRQETGENGVFLCLPTPNCKTIMHRRRVKERK